MQNQLQTETQITPPTTPAMTQEAPAATEAAAEIQETQAVRKRFTEIRRKTVRHKKRFWTLFWLFEVIAVLPALLMSFLPSLRHSPLNFVPVWVSCVAAMSIIVFLVSTLTRKPKWSAAELAQTGGIQAVPALAGNAFSARNPAAPTPNLCGTAGFAAPAPTRRRALLNQSHRRMLNRMLRLGTAYVVDIKLGNTMRFAILKALAQVGDATSLATIERMANTDARLPGQERIRQAAIECLPLLKAPHCRFSIQSNASPRLLRPCRRARNAPATGLKGQRNSPEQLLRAANSDADTPRL